MRSRLPSYPILHPHFDHHRVLLPFYQPTYQKLPRKNAFECLYYIGYIIKFTYEKVHLNAHTIKVTHAKMHLNAIKVLAVSLSASSSFVL